MMTKTMNNRVLWWVCGGCGGCGATFGKITPYKSRVKRDFTGIPTATHHTHHTGKGLEIMTKFETTRHKDRRYRYLRVWESRGLKLPANPGDCIGWRGNRHTLDFKVVSGELRAIRNGERMRYA